MRPSTLTHHPLSGQIMDGQNKSAPALALASLSSRFSTHLGCNHLSYRAAKSAWLYTSATYPSQFPANPT